MLEPISKEDVKHLKVVPYEQIRSSLRSGDLFFASGDYLFSQAIQKVTQSAWSHVGIVFYIESIDRMLLLESVEDMGVRFAPLSKYVKDYRNGKPYEGQAVLARCEGCDRSVVERVAAFGLDALTRPYDKDEIAKILSRITLGIGKKELDTEYICSELVYECFAKAGLEFKYNTKGFISPGDIWADHRISLQCRIL